MSRINIKIFMNTSVESDKSFLEMVTVELSHPSINQSECVLLFICDLMRENYKFTNAVSITGSSSTIFLFL